MKVLAVVALFFSQFCYGQIAGYIDLGIGAQNNNAFNFLSRVGGGIGITPIKDLYIFGGLTFTDLKTDISTRSDSKSGEKPTEDIYDIHVVSGIRYSITLKKFGKEAKFERIGIFPEARIYFNPLVERSLTYYNNNYELETISGKFNTQFSTGIGFGIFAGSLEEEYFAIRYDFTTIDPFSTLRNLNYPQDQFDFSKGYQHLISLSVFIQ